MAKVNKNYLKLPGSYLFSRIGQKVAQYQKDHPEAEIIRLGIGDVTRPIAPAVINALNKAVAEMKVSDSIIWNQSFSYQPFN